MYGTRESLKLHHIGFLPIYVARNKGYFKDEGIDLRTAVMPSGGLINATLSGDAFAYIASVDHNAFARANGKSLIAVSNLLGRANIYMMARTDIPPMTGDLPSYLKGKRIGVSSYGGTPNNVLRYFLKKWNLDARKDHADRGGEFVGRSRHHQDEAGRPRRLVRTVHHAALQAGPVDAADFKRRQGTGPVHGHGDERARRHDREGCSTSGGIAAMPNIPFRPPCTPPAQGAR
jgi:hypothetical protein